jgi:hypothetical protein
MKEMRKNRYNPVTDVLVLTDAQVYGLEKVHDYYHHVFTNGDGWGLQKGLIKESDMPKTHRAWVAKGDQFSKLPISSSGRLGYQALQESETTLRIQTTGHIIKTREIQCRFPPCGGAEQV